MLQLILHLIGDYITQSDWMAQNKTKRMWPAAVHATVYAIPFYFLCHDSLAWLVITWTHFFIDRYRLAVFVVWAKNIMFDPRGWQVMWHALRTPFFSPLPSHLEAWVKRTQWENCNKTGYPSDTSEWLAVWLMIVADNTIHLSINYLAIRYL